MTIASVHELFHDLPPESIDADVFLKEFREETAANTARLNRARNRISETIESESILTDTINDLPRADADLLLRVRRRLRKTIRGRSDKRIWPWSIAFATMAAAAWGVLLQPEPSQILPKSGSARMPSKPIEQQPLSPAKPSQVTEIEAIQVAAAPVQSPAQPPVHIVVKDTGRYGDDVVHQRLATHQNALIECAKGPLADIEIDVNHLGYPVQVNAPTAPPEFASCALEVLDRTHFPIRASPVAGTGQQVRIVVDLQLEESL